MVSSDDVVPVSVGIVEDGVAFLGTFDALEVFDCGAGDDPKLEMGLVVCLDVDFCTVASLDGSFDTFGCATNDGVADCGLLKMLDELWFSDWKGCERMPELVLG